MIRYKNILTGDVIDCLDYQRLCSEDKVMYVEILSYNYLYWN